MKRYVEENKRGRELILTSATLLRAFVFGVTLHISEGTQVSLSRNPVSGLPFISSCEWNTGYDVTKPKCGYCRIDFCAF